MSGEGSFLATAAAKEWARTKSKKGPSPTKSSPATTPRGSESASSQHRENSGRAHNQPNAREEQAASSPPAYQHQQRVSPMLSSRLDKERGSRAASPRGGATRRPLDMSGGFIPYSPRSGGLSYSPILDRGKNSPRSNLHPTSPASVPYDAYGTNPTRTPRQRHPDASALSLNNSLVGASIVTPSSGIPGGGRGDDASPREFSQLPQSPIMHSAHDLSGIPVSRPQLLAQLDERDAQVASLKNAMAAERHAGELRVAVLEHEAIALREAVSDARGKENAAVEDAERTRAGAQVTKPQTIHPEPKALSPQPPISHSRFPWPPSFASVNLGLPFKEFWLPCCTGVLL